MTEERDRRNFRDAQQWFAELDKYNSEPFVFDREQPLTLDRVIFEDEDGDLRSEREV